MYLWPAGEVEEETHGSHQVREEHPEKHPEGDAALLEVPPVTEGSDHVGRVRQEQAQRDLDSGSDGSVEVLLALSSLRLPGPYLSARMEVRSRTTTARWTARGPGKQRRVVVMIRT